MFEHITAALAAIEALHNKYHWTGGETTMVLEWADPSRHRRENPNTKGTRLTPKPQTWSASLGLLHPVFSSPTMV